MNVFITGASFGIGEALAVRLAAPGGRVGLLARRRDELDRVAEKCRARGAMVSLFPADVRDAAGVRAAAQAFLQAAGSVDAVIANAGVSRRDDEARTEADLFREIIEVNVLGVIYTLSPFIDHMERVGVGSLVAISSVSGVRGLPNAGVYSSSKAAVNTWMESLRIRLRGRVHVMTVCPGFVATPMTASNRFHMPWIMTADDAATRIERGIRRKQSVLVFPAPMRALMAVAHLLPRFLYEPVASWVGRQRAELLKKQPPEGHS